MSSKKKTQAKKVQVTSEAQEPVVEATAENLENQENAEVVEQPATETESMDEGAKLDAAAERAAEEAREAVRNAKIKAAKEKAKAEEVAEEVKKSEPKTVNTFTALLNQRTLRSKGSFGGFQAELARRQGKMPETKVGFNELLQRRLLKKY